ncbi:MAG: lamin tail domain-containing protein [Bacteroidota bacterium]
MKKILFLLFFPVLCNAQINDDFSDGDFTNNPVWTGNDTSFVVENYELRSNGPQSAATLYLSTPSTLLMNTEWDFLIDLKFNPTISNFVRVYLVSDAANVNNAQNAYYVEIGQTNADNIKFYKKVLGASSLLFTGTSSFANNVKVRLKISRDNLANWNIFADATGGNILVPEGASFYDNSVVSSAFFGVYCQYSTVSRFNQFYFDDFYVGPIIADTTKPVVSNVKVVSQNQLDVKFSESVETISAQTVSNYTVDNLIGFPTSATKDASDPSLVHLSFGTSFSQGLINHINICNLKDFSGNVMLTQSFPFGYYVPKAFDVLINELMIDPTPIVGLPDAEWIELYNRTHFPISLNGWSLVVGSSLKVLPDINILPDSFLIITSTANQTLLQSYGPTVALSSLSLTNTGSDVVLLNANKEVISFVSYGEDWYKDPNKKDGGWSLELISTLTPCEGESNWEASLDPSGGTPGRKNSSLFLNPDIKEPSISRVSVIDSLHLQVFFSEPMDSASLLQTNSYLIDNGIGNPDQIKLVYPDYASVLLQLNHPLSVSVVYTLRVSDTLEDCVGNKIDVSIIKEFAIPQAANVFDVVINEILIDPTTSGEQFIELYNRSNKVIDMKQLELANSDNGSLSSVKEITADGFLLFPGKYVAISTNPEKVKHEYFTPNPEAFIKIVSMPTYYISSGVVVLVDRSLKVIDQFNYNVDMQYPLLTSTNGVSLERIHYDRPAQERSNWHSASSDVGYGTPAYKNSQFSDNVASDDPISLSPEMFSPDNDGYNDVLNISYTFAEPNYVANISIFNSKGGIIRNLEKNQLLGTQGTFTWDGLDNDKQKAGIGIYIIYVEVFDLNGNVKHYKKTAVLAGKL